MSLWLIAIAAALSGFAALGFELIWLRRLSELLGSSVYAINVVLAVFFLGLGLGARIVGPISDGRARGRVSLFAILEGIIALAGLTFLPLSIGLERAYDALTPAEWPFAAGLAVKAIVAALALCVPTLAMGGTLPALVRLTDRRPLTVRSRLGLLYGLNTAGGALGVLVTLFATLPVGGTDLAIATAVTANLGAIALAWLGTRVGSAAEPRPAAERTLAHEPSIPSTTAGAERLSPRSAGGGDPMLIAAAFVSGLVSVSLEVAWTRALSARFLGTVYSFGAILFVYLALIGVGSVVLGGIGRSVRLGRRAYVMLTLAAGVAALASVPLLGMVPTDLSYGALPTLAGRLRHELMMAILVMSPSLLLFGLGFPLLVDLFQRGTSVLGRDLGRIYLANTLGAVTAPLVVGLAVLPAIGLRHTFLAVSIGAIVFAAGPLARWAALSRPTRALTGVAALAAITILWMAAPADLRLWQHGPQDRLIAYRDGRSATISVAMEPDSTVFLKVDNNYRLGDTRTRFAQQRQGLLPLLLHPDPGRALFIGVGTGASAGAAAEFGDVAVDALDLLPELMDFLPYFASINFDLAEKARADDDVRVLAVDARHYVRTTSRRYDVVVGDLFVPWRAGEGQMYAREHIEAVRDVLAFGGIFCQWLPGYQLRIDETRTIVATFLDVFPSTLVFWLYFNAAEPAIGLVGSMDPLAFDPVALAERMNAGTRHVLLHGVGLGGVREVFGGFVAGRDSLAAWSGDRPLDTRRHPIIEFSAPIGRFGDETERSRAHVVEMLKLTTPLGREPSFAAVTPSTRTALEQYQRGVAHYMRGRHATLYTRNLPVAIASHARAFLDIPDSRLMSGFLEGVVREALESGAFQAAEPGIDALENVAATAYLGHYLAAESAVRQRDVETAIAELDLAIRINPDHRPSLHLRELLTTGGAEGP